MKKQHYSVYLKAFSLPVFLSVLGFIPKTFTLIDEIKKIIGTSFTVLLNAAAIIILISRLFQGFVSRYKADEEQIIYKRFFFRKKILNIPIDKITAFCIIRSPLNRLTKSKTIIFKSGNISSYAKGIKITVSENEMNFQESAGFDGKKEKVNNLSLLLCALLRPATFLNLFVIWFPLLWAGLLFVVTATYNANVLSISVITSTLAFSIGAFINILLFFNKYYGYTVIKKEDYLKASYGFISKYDYYLKSDKISAVVIYQNVFMRILGLRSIEMYVVGFFNAHNYLFPACKKSKVKEITENLLDEYKFVPPTYFPPKKAVFYYMTFPVLIFSTLMITLFLVPEIIGFKITIGALATALLLFIMYRFITLTTNRYTVTENSFIFSKGGLSKKIYIINKKKIEAVKEKTTFFKLRKKLSKGEIYLHANENNAKIKTGLFNFNTVTSLIYKKNPYKISKTNIKKL